MDSRFGLGIFLWMSCGFVSAFYFVVVLIGCGVIFWLLDLGVGWVIVFDWVLGLVISVWGCCFMITWVSSVYLPFRALLAIPMDSEVTQLFSSSECCFAVNGRCFKVIHSLEG